MAQSEFIKEFFAEARENLQTAEEDVLALEQAGPSRDAEMINRRFGPGSEGSGGERPFRIGVNVTSDTFAVQAFFSIHAKFCSWRSCS